MVGNSVSEMKAVEAQIVLVCFHINKETLVSYARVLPVKEFEKDRYCVCFCLIYLG